MDFFETIAVEVGVLKAKVVYLEQMLEATIRKLDNQPERSKREDRYIDAYFPPPWNPHEHPEKTEGWIAFQEEQRKDPEYYGCGALNIVETQ